MWDWIGSNASALNVGLNAAMLLIWLAYLQLFFVSFRRSNRTVIHIGMASESGEDARCLVTNMGSDTAYVLAVMVGLDDGDRTRLAPVTDRVEDEDPIGGDFRDKIGDMRNSCERKNLRNNVNGDGKWVQDRLDSNISAKLSESVHFRYTITL